MKRLLHAASALVLVTALGPLCLLLLPARGVRRIAEVAGGLCFVASVLAPGPLWPLGGFLLLLLAWAPLPGLWKKVRSFFNDADTLFLWLWAAAGLAVPVVYNQSAVKYLNLAQVPLVLLLLRGRKSAAEITPARGLSVAALTGGLALALLVSDVRHATACRDVIVEQVQRARALGGGVVYLAGTPWGGTVYGVDNGGHWLGGTVAPGSDAARALQPGDQLLDLSFPGQLAVPTEGLQLLEERTADDPFPLRLMGAGAGYWSSDWGFAPFSLGGGPYLTTYRVRVVRKVAEPPL